MVEWRWFYCIMITGHKSVTFGNNNNTGGHLFLFLPLMFGWLVGVVLNGCYQWEMIIEMMAMIQWRG